MRRIDWVDRLAGVRTFEVDTETLPDARLIAEGKWLTWPKWRRLVDLARARTMYVVTTVRMASNPQWRRYSYRAMWLDAARAVHDIHLHYRYERAESGAD